MESGHSYRVEDDTAYHSDARELKRYIPEPMSGCWLWEGSVNKKGYGVVNTYDEYDNNVSVGAHRFFYTHLVGPIPDGLSILHKCDTPTCVNPDHLYAGTNADNVRDRVRRGKGPPGFRGTKSQR